MVKKSKKKEDETKKGSRKMRQPPDFVTQNLLIL